MNFFTAFVDLIPDAVMECLNLDFGLAGRVKDALLKGDLDALEEMIV